MRAARLPERGVAAHRGGAATHPENTLAAFREAVRLGAHQIELDVRATADGELVVLHDAEVDRTTDGRGALRSLSWDAVRRLDAGRWKAEGFAGERIPRLAEVLAALPHDVWINVQIKRGEPVAEEVARQIAEQGRLHQAFVACGNRDAERARAIRPDLMVCNLVRQRTREAYVEHAIATGAQFVQFHWLRGAPEPALLERAHAAGLRVNHFCAPDADDWEELFRAGVDFALVDDVPAALASARRAGIEPLSRPPEAATG